MAGEASSRQRREDRSGAASLVGAAVVAGLTSYAFVIVGVRAFGAETFAPIAVIWSLWAIAAAGVSTPLQHWIIQTVGVTGSELVVRQRRLRLTASVFGLSAVAGVSAYVTRAALYGSAEPVFPVVSGAIVTTAALAGYVRGVLGARNRFGALAASLAGDGVLRLVLLVAVIAVGLGIEAAAVTVPAATLIVVCWSSTFHLSRTPSPAMAPPPLGALSGAFLLLHAVLNAPPVVAAALDADPVVVSSLFAAFALFRAPFLVVSTLATKVSYALAGRVGAGALDGLAAFRRVITITTVAGMAIGWFLGMAPADWLLRLVYGSEVALRTGEGPAIVAGSVGSVGVLLLVLLVAARGSARPTLAPLLGSSLLGVAWTLAAPGQPGTRVAAGFLASQLMALAALVLVDRSVARATDTESVGEGRTTA